MESESDLPITLSFMAERTRVPAPGLEGGEPGGLGDVRINGRSVNHRQQHVVTRGDRILLRTPGGGGYRPPGERDRERAERDRRLGYTEDG
jgi:N-methylhydantoinase B